MRAALTIIPLILASSALQAEDRPKEGARVELISEVSAIRPGEPFRLGIQITHAEGYHSYWKSPGIVGYPTTIAWKLPDGFEAGPLAWPAPEIVDMAGHRAHGYHRDVLLTTTITPPDKIKGEVINLTAEASWMACADACHPGDKSLTISLPVKDKAFINSSHVKLFKKADQEVPQPLEKWSATILSKKDSSTIVLQLTPKSKMIGSLEAPYFFSLDGQISSTKPEVIYGEDQSVLLKFERSEYSPKEASGIPGILRYKSNGETFFAEINPKY